MTEREPNNRHIEFSIVTSVLASEIRQQLDLARQIDAAPKDRMAERAALSRLRLRIITLLSEHGDGRMLKRLISDNERYHAGVLLMRSINDVLADQTSTPAEQLLSKLQALAGNYKEHPPVPPDIADYRDAFPPAVHVLLEPLLDVDNYFQEARASRVHLATQQLIRGQD